MSSDGSVTLLLARLRDGTPEGSADAASGLSAALLRRPGGAGASACRGPRRAADEEDIALSALDSLFRAEAAGRFPRLADRDALWRVLATITLRKVSDAIVHEGRQKRGAGRMPSRAVELDELFAHEPSPDMAAQLADLVAHLIERLGDDVLRRLALLKIQGHTEEEMAAALGVSPRTVRRKLDLVRRLWEREAG